MTKYSVDVCHNGEWESIALFSDRADFGAMADFCVSQFQNGNSLDCPAESIAIIDVETGEILQQWETASDDDPYEIEWDDHYWDDGCPIDNVDESNYDPYTGCDMYECDSMW